MRLETVEDFERVAQALVDPNSYPCQYEVKSFGYCRKCHKVTESEGNSSLEGIHITCLGCGACFAHFFGMSLPPGALPTEMYSTNKDDMPQAARDEIELRQSRVMQLSFFIALLDRRKQASRQAEHRARSEVRRLAKIASLLALAAQTR